MEQSERLRQYNAWRRDNTGDLPMPNPTELGELIDGVADRLEVLERESAEHFERWHEERRKREFIEGAAKNLIEQKGRHNTEVAYKILEGALKQLHNGGGNSP